MRNGLKQCQCGARAVWTPSGKRRSSRGGAGGTEERLQCPACGNRTGDRLSRQKLAEEWNSAGWCGQGPDAPEYVPFGDEWRAECGRLRKSELINLLAAAYKRGYRMEGLMARLRCELGDRDRMIARLRVKRNRRELFAVVDRLVQQGVIERIEGRDERSTLNVQRSTLKGDAHE